MPPVLAYLLATLIAAVTAVLFFRHPSWSEGDAAAQGIKWGSLFSAIIFGFVTLVAAIRIVL